MQPATPVALPLCLLSSGVPTPPRPQAALLAVHHDRAALTWTVKTEVFDGPLDLLLYLVRRDGIDIRKVRIARVADSYLSFLDTLRDLHISVAADYLVMAATLCHLKSLELLPRPPSVMEEDEDGLDPREALARRLEAYEAYKQAAEALARLPRLNREVFDREPLDVGEVDRPLIPGVDAFGLLEAYHRVLTKPVAPVVQHTVHRPEVDLGACCRQVLKELGGPGGTSTLTAILRSFKTRAERVISFLAVLEMCRLGWLGLEQDGHLASIQVSSRVHADQSLDAIRGEDLGLAEVG